MVRKVYCNGKILTQNRDEPLASFLVEEEGKIVQISTGADALQSAIAQAPCQVFDLQGKTVLPGFVESHNHFQAVSSHWGWVDVGIRQCATIAQVLERIAAAVQEQQASWDGSSEAPLPWIKCVGYDDTLVEECRDITRHELDQVSGPFPVWVWHPSLHRAYVNSKALEIAGITDQVQDPQGGVFVRDQNGSLTGQMEEMPAYQQVYLWLNKTVDIRNKGKDMWSAARYFASRGVTSVQDLFVGPLLFQLYALSFQAHSAENPFPIRVSVYSPPTWADRPASTGFDSNYLRFAGFKLFADGSIQCHTACCSQPYHDQPSTLGALSMPAEQLKQAVLKFHQLGQQIAVHCNGDGAIEAFISAVENAQALMPKPDIRHRIEHCQLVTDEQLARMHKAGICANFFIGHVYYWGDRHANKFLGEERAKRISPLRSALDAQVPFALHSDCPVTPVDPLHSIWVAAARLTKSNKELGADQKISVEQAIRAYTIDGAYLGKEEALKGSLEVGKFADFIVLSANPLEVPLGDIPEIQIEATFVGGRQVHGDSLSVLEGKL